MCKRRPPARRRLLAVTLVPLALLACTNSHSPPDPPADDAAPPEEDAGVPVTLANDCRGEMPTLHSDPVLLMFLTSDLTDYFDYFGASECRVASPLSGRDGFFLMDSSAGERWQVMVRPTAPDQDVAVYFLGNCDERSCRRLQDRCGGGQSEHANFIAPYGGSYIVGIESSTASPVMVMLLSPACGDGVLSHGEACDDGNTDEEDGCDNLCRTELLDATANEVEPNDDVILANVVVLPGGTGEATVSGTLGGPCDADRYALQVPDGASILVTALGASGAACGAATPPMELVLTEIGEMGFQEWTLGAGTTGGAGGSCPSIEVGVPFATGLVAGEYQLTIEVDHDTARFEYQLRLEVVPAP